MHGCVRELKRERVRAHGLPRSRAPDMADEYPGEGGFGDTGFGSAYSAESAAPDPYSAPYSAGTSALAEGGVQQYAYGDAGPYGTESSYTAPAASSAWTQAPRADGGDPSSGWLDWFKRGASWVTTSVAAFTAFDWVIALLVVGIICVVASAVSGAFHPTAVALQYDTAWPAWADPSGNMGASDGATSPTPYGNGPIGVITLSSQGPALVAFASIATVTKGTVVAPFPPGAPAVPTMSTPNSNVLVWVLDTSVGKITHAGVPPSDVCGYKLRTDLPLHSAFSDITYGYFIYGPGTAGFTVDAVPLTDFTLAPGATASAATTVTGIGGSSSAATGLFPNLPGDAGLFGGLPTGISHLCGFYNPLGAPDTTVTPPTKHPTIAPWGAPEYSAAVAVLIYGPTTTPVNAYNVMVFPETATAGKYGTGSAGSDMYTAFDADFGVTPPTLGNATCPQMWAAYPKFMAAAALPGYIPTSTTSPKAMFVNSLMECGAPVHYLHGGVTLDGAKTDATQPHIPCATYDTFTSHTANANATALSTCAAPDSAVIDENLMCAAWNGSSTTGSFAVYFFVQTAGNGQPGAANISNSGRSSIVRAWDGITVGPSMPGLNFSAELAALMPILTIPEPKNSSICHPTVRNWGEASQ